MSVFFEMVDEVKDMIEPPRERFYDEHDEPELPEFYGCCGACCELDRCDIPGHEEVGYCNAQGEFHLVTDPDECD